MISLKMDNVGSVEFAHESRSTAVLNQQKLLQLLLVSFIAPSKHSIMPLAPSSTELPTAYKPKIGFSIDSIVGGDQNRRVRSSISKIRYSSPCRSEKTSSNSNDNINEQQSQASATPSPEPSFTDISDKTRASLLAARHLNSFAHLHHHQQFLYNNSISNTSSIVSHSQRPNPIPNHQLHSQGSNSSSPPTNNSSGVNSPSCTTTSTTTILDNHNNRNSSSNSIISSTKKIPNNRINTDEVTTTSSPSPPPPGNPSPSPSPQENSDDSLINKPPVPLPSSHALSQHDHRHHHFTPPGPQPSHPPHLSPHLPPIGTQGIPQFAAYPPGMLNFAAAAAAAAAAQHHHPGLPGWMPPSGPHPPSTHPLYPWFLAKHSRFFPHRFGPGPDLPGFLLQPFRKPKRIRTAFSPSQLLKLEHAFERNHYVVGAERKQLASSLALSETQVKVWFQNRRTKHKRMQQEEESVKKLSGSGGASSSGNGSSASNLSSSAISADSSTRNNYNFEEMLISDDEENEEIIMEDDYSAENDEKSHLQRLNRVM